jgi:hypothetical protein
MGILPAEDRSLLTKGYCSMAPIRKNPKTASKSKLLNNRAINIILSGNISKSVVTLI